MNSNNTTMETSSNNVIVLEIQGTLINCNRQDLIANSDYFKAMFEGNFVESSKNMISLNDIEVEAMNTILKLLWDREYNIEEENLLSVLQAACMLQFLEIKDICIEKINASLSEKNCLKIWLYTEHLDLKPVYLKAKLLALLEFMVVKDSNYFLELNQDEIINYLGNVNLQCFDEMVVFEALIKWYRNVGDKSSDLLKLLHCLDFSDFTDTDICKIMEKSEIRKNQQVVEVLQCILHKKNNHDISIFEEHCIQNALSLLKSKSRHREGFLCILFDNVRMKENNTPVDLTVLYYDKFKRKRKYNVLENSSNTDLSVISIDTKSFTLKKLLDIDPQKCANLDGFKMLGHKQFVYLFGGEYLLGKGDWNCSFHVYDVIKEKWKQREPLPYPRRHFESCICGNNLFIVGGTGPFRVIQENIFWYNLVEKKWSKEEKLPCSGRQIKCCSFNNKLFILNINNKCGYSFDSESKLWSKLCICDMNNVLPHYSEMVSVFCYKSSLYIKGNKLFKLKLEGNNLVIVKEDMLPDLQKGTCQMESVLCNSLLFSLYKQWCDDSQKISLELFNVDTCEVFYDLEKTSDEIMVVDNEMFKFRSHFVVFNVFHPNLVIENDLLHDSV